MSKKHVDLLIQQYNDVGNAERLIAHRGDDIRYCPEFRGHIIWDGQRWQRDRLNRAREFAQETALEFNRQAFAARDEKAENFARQSLDSKRLTAMLKEAEPRHSVLAAQLDSNPWLLNFTNGTVDLRTSRIRPHRRKDLITKLVNYKFVAKAKCPTFLQFLHRIMGAHPGASKVCLKCADRMVSYLQKVFGYALTGITSEKVVFVLLGDGNNGKTTLLSLFHRLIEEYAALLQIETLMVRQHSNNTLADLAALRGARYVTTSETDEGQRLAEGTLKRITQGMGKISATRKYENPIDFDETHKLFLDCNHKPQIKGTDQAMWNRLHLIPFEEVISIDEIDRALPEKLHAEAEGILAWTVKGTARWRREGLGKPAEVALAVDAWRAEMDQIGRFRSEVCTAISGIRTPARSVYSAYKTWAQEAGEDYVSEVLFSKRMVAQGAVKGSSNRGVYYDGLALLGIPVKLSACSGGKPNGIPG
jgi:putative DNA primase/helicase